MPLDLPRPPGRRRSSTTPPVSQTSTRLSHKGFRLPPKRSSPRTPASPVVQSSSPPVTLPTPDSIPSAAEDRLPLNPQNHVVESPPEIPHLAEKFSTMNGGANSSAPESQHEKLPDGWTEYYADDGRPFFVHQSSGNVTWDRPASETTAVDPPAATQTPDAVPPQENTAAGQNLPHGWTTATTEDGRTYYCNTVDGTTSWELPVEHVSPERAVASTPTEANVPTNEEPEVVQTVESKINDAAAESTDEPLPPGWVQSTTVEGLVFYYNQVDNSTTWERPKYSTMSEHETPGNTDAAKENAVDANEGHSEVAKDDPTVKDVNETPAKEETYLLPPGWTEMQAETGEVYYYNEADGSSSWDRPHLVNDLVQEKGTTVATTDTVVADTPKDTLDEAPETFVENAGTQSPWKTPVLADTEFSAERVQDNGPFPDPVESEHESPVRVLDQREESALPPNWSEAKTDTGEAYYCNELDGSTTWERPQMESGVTLVRTVAGETAPVAELRQTPESTVETNNATHEIPPANETTKEQIEENVAQDSLAVEQEEAEGQMNNVTQIQENYLLPPGWYESHDSEGRPFYYKEDGTMSWERPHLAKDLVRERGTTATTNETVVAETAFTTSTELDEAPETTIESNNDRSEPEATSGGQEPVGTDAMREPNDAKDSIHEAHTYPLPQGWVELLTVDGNVYYCNQADGSTQWERPTSAMEPETDIGCPTTLFEQETGPDRDNGPESSVDTMDIPPGWKQTTEDGMIFYRHEDETGQETEEKRCAFPQQESFADSGRAASVKSDEFSYEEIRHEPARSGNASPETSSGEEYPIVKNEANDENDIPDGWVVVEDDQGGTFYYNKSDGRTSWEKPECVDKEMRSEKIQSEDAVSVTTSKASLPPNWHEMEHEDGKPYYYNEMTGETTWDRPQPQYSADALQQKEEEIEIKDDAAMTAKNGEPVSGHHDDEIAKTATGTDKNIALQSDDDNAVKKESLDQEWVEAYTSSGDMYYICPETGETSWSKPTCSTQPQYSADAQKEDGEEIENRNDEDLAVEDDDFVSGHQTDDDDGPGVAEAIAGTDQDVSDDKTAEKRSSNQEWVETFTDTGEMYYFCPETGETSWTKPASLEGREDEAQTASASSKLPTGWIECETVEGETYYLHEPSNETSWEKPQDVAIGGSKIGVSSLTSEKKHHSTNEGKQSSYRHSIGNRPGAIVSMGFPGKICVVQKQFGIVVIKTMRSFVENESVCKIENGKASYGIVGPFVGAHKSHVSQYIEQKLGSDNDLWQLVSVAEKSKGKLKSSQGAGNPSSPEAQIVEFLLNDYHCAISTDSSKKALGDNFEEVEKLLLRGQRLEAIEAAIRHGNFAMALLIAHLVDPDVFQHVARTYLDQADTKGSAMHTLALLFAGLLQPPSDGSRIKYWDELGDEELLGTWKQHLAGILSNPVLDWELLVIALGERLSRIKNAGIVPAHFCYLVCGGSIGFPKNSSPIWLLGYDHTLSNLEIDLAAEAFVLTEAYEWSKRRGNPNVSISSLQALRIWYAFVLCDFGYVVPAMLYLESCLGHLGQTMTTSNSEFLNLQSEDDGSLLAFARKLHDRLNGEISTNITKTSQAPSDTKGYAPKQDLSFVTARSDISVDDMNEVPEPSKPPTQPVTTSNPPFPKHEGSQTPLVQPLQPVPTNNLPFPNEEEETQTTEAKEQKLESKRPDLPTLDTLNEADGNPSLITPGAAVPPVEQKPRSAPKSAPANLQTNTKTGVKKKGFFSLGIKDSVTKWLNPDATTADLGDGMEAYYDETRKVWVFPGEDPAEKAKPIAPPPMAVSRPSAPAPAPSAPTSAADPLAAMMAPPPRSLKKPVAPGPPNLPPGSNATGKPPVNFAAFAPPKPSDT